MNKKSHKARYSVFLEHLKMARYNSGLSQVVLSEKLKEPQTFVSKCERGERRMDVIDLLSYLAAVKADPVKFIDQLTIDLKNLESRKPLSAPWQEGGSPVVYMKAIAKRKQK